jgi:hypothetical protein
LLHWRDALLLLDLLLDLRDLQATREPRPSSAGSQPRAGRGTYLVVYLNIQLDLLAGKRSDPVGPAAVVSLSPAEGIGAVCQLLENALDQHPGSWRGVSVGKDVMLALSALLNEGSTGGLRSWGRGSRGSW